MGRNPVDRFENLVIENDVGCISRETHLQLVYESIYCILNGITAKKPEKKPDDS